MKKAIVTGFEPFGPYKFNPTQDLAKEYDGKRLGEIEVVGLVLPCTYRGAFEVLSKKIDEISPDIVLSMGLASRVKCIRIETRGKNLMDAKYSDADGLNPDNEPILSGEQEFYLTRTNSQRLLDALSKAGVHSEISDNADAFVCNSLLYLTSRKLFGDSLIEQAYIHIPWPESYLDRIELEPEKVTIKDQDLRKGIEILLSEMAR